MTISKLKLLWRPIVLIVALAALFSLARAFHVIDRFDELRAWINSLGVWGPVAFVTLFMLGVVAALPTPMMKVSAALLFGMWKGAIVIIIATTLGASLSFLISRYFARDSIARWLSRKKKFRKLDEMTERYGIGIVAVTRLVPIIPFSILNYGFGLTKVRFFTYVALSFVCMIPNATLYVIGTDIFYRGVGEGEVAGAVVVALTVVLTVLLVITRYARRYTRETAVNA